MYEEQDDLFPSKVTIELVSTKTGKHIGEVDVKINSSRTNCHGTCSSFRSKCKFNTSFDITGDIGELEGLRIELEDSRDMLDQEQRSKTMLERKLQELEQILDDQKMDSENIQHTLTAKVMPSSKSKEILDLTQLNLKSPSKHQAGKKGQNRMAQK